MRESNEQLEQRLEAAGQHRQRVESLLQRVVDQKDNKEEHKILSMNVDALEDPYAREYFRGLRNKIQETHRQEEQQRQGTCFASNDFDQYFQNIGGSGSGLPDY